MTTATEHHDAQLAAIKARHAALAQKFTDPAVTEIAIDADAPLLYQLGLEAVFVDLIGRFWKMSGTSAVMLFDPQAAFRPGVCDVDFNRPKVVAEWLEFPASQHQALVLALGGDAAGVHFREPVQPLTYHDPDDTQAAQGFPAKEG